MPQWVTNKAPSALSFVPGIMTCASSTTVPMRACRASSPVSKVNSEGTGFIVSCPSAFSQARLSSVAPPVVTAMQL